MAGTHPTLSFLAFLILLSGFYKYGERVWVLRAASQEHFKDSFAESRPHRKDSGEIEAECESKQEEGFDVVPHRVIDVDNEDAIMIDVAIAEFSSKKPSCGKDSEDPEYKRVAGTLLSASRLVDTSQRLFADHLFSLEERDSCLSILRGKHCAENFKVIEIELGLIYDMFYSKAKAVYTGWGCICRLAIFFSICVALGLFSFTDKRPYSKPDLFLTLLLLGAAIFVELYALAKFLFSDQFACWLIEKKQSAVFYFINGIRIRPLLKRRRWSNSMGQYNLMSFKKNYSRWWSFLKLQHIEEMVVKFLYRGHENVTDEIKKLILSKIEEMEARDLPKWDAQKPQEREAQERQAFQMRDRGIHALSKHKLLNDKLRQSIELLDFDESILVWHIATELRYYLDYGWGDSNKEKEKSSVGLHLSRYMIYVQYMCPSMLPARFGSIRFRDIYKEPSQYFDLSEIPPDNAEARGAWLYRMMDKIRQSGSEEDQVKSQVKSVLRYGCGVAWGLQRVPRGWRWSAINEVWVEMVMYGANKCKARDHAQHMRGGSELITHVWLLMAHYGLTDSVQKSTRRPTETAEIIVNPW